MSESNQNTDTPIIKEQTNNPKKSNRNRGNKFKKDQHIQHADSNNKNNNNTEPNTKLKSKLKSAIQLKPNKNASKPVFRALYKELEKLLTYITPVTVNGLPVKNLSIGLLQFLDNVLNDKTNNDEIFMTFFLKPSDPDFPFDIELLTLTLCIPQSYPNKFPSPTLMVLNDDIPRGYSLNIEIGFKQIVATILENRMKRKNSKKNDKKETKVETKSDKKEKKNDKIEEAEGEEEMLKIEVVGGNDLTGMITTLDKYLEKFLIMQKQDTIKLVRVINKKQETVSSAQTAKEKETAEKQVARPLANAEPTFNQERYRRRIFELEKFRQRLVDNNIAVFKDNSHGTVYKMCLYFKDDHLTLEFDESDQIVIEKLYTRLTVPKEYLNNPKKGLKLAIDMSNSHNIELVNSIKNTNVRLIFGKLINNISKNFDSFGADISSINCANPDSDADTFWTITSQLNFFIHNIQKFMNEKVEFEDWYHANKELNSS